MTATAEIADVTAATFHDVVLAAERPVLVEFWGRGCGPCRMLAPILTELAADFAGALRVVKVDGDHELDLVVSSGVMGFPTLHLYRGGELTASILGVRSKAHLYEQIRDAL